MNRKIKAGTAFVQAKKYTVDIERICPHVALMRIFRPGKTPWRDPFEMMVVLRLSIDGTSCEIQGLRLEDRQSNILFLSSLRKPIAEALQDLGVEEVTWQRIHNGESRRVAFRVPERRISDRPRSAPVAGSGAPSG